MEFKSIEKQAVISLLAAIIVSDEEREQAEKMKDMSTMAD